MSSPRPLPEMILSMRLFVHGARNSFSVFYVPILDEFGWTRASTAGIFCVNAIAYGMTGPFAGALVDRFGPKRVLLIGSSLIAYPAGAAALPHWFVRRRGMAFGILTSGSGISFVMIPLVQYLINQVGWRTSFLWFGIIIGAILLPLVALFSRHRAQDMDLLPDGAHAEEKVRTSLDNPQNRPCELS